MHTFTRLLTPPAEFSLDVGAKGQHTYTPMTPFVHLCFSNGFSSNYGTVQKQAPVVKPFECVRFPGLGRLLHLQLRIFFTFANLCTSYNWCQNVKVQKENTIQMMWVRYVRFYHCLCITLFVMGFRTSHFEVMRIVGFSHGFYEPKPNAAWEALLVANGE